MGDSHNRGRSGGDCKNKWSDACEGRWHVGDTKRVFTLLLNYSHQPSWLTQYETQLVQRLFFLSCVTFCVRYVQKTYELLCPVWLTTPTKYLPVLALMTLHPPLPAWMYCNRHVIFFSSPFVHRKITTDGVFSVRSAMRNHETDGTEKKKCGFVFDV